MKKLFCLLLFIFCLSHNSIAKEVWTITSLSWPPYAGPELEGEGKSIQKLRALLKKHDIDLQVEFHPWIRSRLLAKNKKYVGYFPAWPEEVNSGFKASSPVDRSKIGFIKIKSKGIYFKDVDELFRKYRFGIVGSYVYPNEIKKIIKKYSKNKITATDEKSLHEMLQANRFDFAITDPKVIQHNYAQIKGSELSVIKVMMDRELVLSLRDTPDNQDKIKKLKKILSKTK